MTDELIRHLLAEAYGEAAESPDPSNQNGALVVDDRGTILARSCNSIPAMSGPALESILADRDRKLKRIIHAEEGATIVAARLGVSTLGRTLICPWFACLPCARSILLAGYKTIIGHARRMATTPDRWRAEVDEATAWLRDSGVELRFYMGPIPEAPTIRVNGEDWQP